MSYARTVVDGLGSQPAALGPPPQRVHLHPGDSYVFRMKGLNVNDTNSAIRGVYQVGRKCMAYVYRLDRGWDGLLSFPLLV